MDTKKTIIRKQVYERISKMPVNVRNEKSEKIVSKLLSLISGKKVILLYHSLPDEVNVNALLDAKQTVLLPVVVNGADLELRVYEGASSLKTGAYNILEPVGRIWPSERYNEIDLVVVPGRAFDLVGHRLGRGKGYYDRLLPQLANAHIVGVCFDCQLFDVIPTDKNDVAMHEVIAL